VDDCDVIVNVAGVIGMAVVVAIAGCCVIVVTGPVGWKLVGWIAGWAAHVCCTGHHSRSF